MNSPERPSEGIEAKRFHEEWNRQFEALSPAQRESVIGSPLGMEAERLAALVKATLALDAGGDGASGKLLRPTPRPSK
jgi:hypothetical protein